MTMQHLCPATMCLAVATAVALLCAGVTPAAADAARCEAVGDCAVMEGCWKPRCVVNACLYEPVTDGVGAHARARSVAGADACPGVSACWRCQQRKHAAVNTAPGHTCMIA